MSCINIRKEMIKRKNKNDSQYKDEADIFREKNLRAIHIRERQAKVLFSILWIIAIGLIVLLIILFVDDNTYRVDF